MAYEDSGIKRRYEQGIFIVLLLFLCCVRVSASTAQEARVLLIDTTYRDDPGLENDKELIEKEFSHVLEARTVEDGLDRIRQIGRKEKIRKLVFLGHGSQGIAEFGNQAIDANFLRKIRDTAYEEGDSSLLDAFTENAEVIFYNCHAGSDPDFLQYAAEAFLAFSGGAVYAQNDFVYSDARLPSRIIIQLYGKGLLPKSFARYLSEHTSVSVVPYTEFQSYRLSPFVQRNLQPGQVVLNGPGVCAVNVSGKGAFYSPLTLVSEVPSSWKSDEYLPYVEYELSRWIEKGAGRRKVREILEQGIGKTGFIISSEDKDTQTYFLRVFLSNKYGRRLLGEARHTIAFYGADIQLSSQAPKKGEVITAKALCLKGAAPKGSLWNWKTTGGLQMLSRGEGANNDEKQIKITGMGEIIATLYDIGSFGKDQVLARAQKKIDPVGVVTQEPTPTPSPSASPIPRPTPSPEPRATPEPRRSPGVASSDPLSALRLPAHWKRSGNDYLRDLASIKRKKEPRDKVLGTVGEDFRQFGDHVSARLAVRYDRATPSMADMEKRVNSFTGKGTKAVRKVNFGGFEGYIARFTEEEKTVRMKGKQDTLSECLIVTAEHGLLLKDGRCIEMEDTVTGRVMEDQSHGLGTYDRMRDEMARALSEVESILSGVPVSPPVAQPEPPPAAEAKVVIRAPRKTLSMGESVSVEAIVENASPDNKPSSYTWSGDCEGSGAKVSFKGKKPGTYKLSVKVSGPRGPIGTASMSFEVGEVTVTIAMTPPEKKLPVGSKAAFTATVLSGGKPMAGSFVFRWQTSSEVSFSPNESDNAKTAATFKKPDTVKIWVVVLKKEGAALSTLVESEQLVLEIGEPKLSMTFSPASPLVGQEVKARVAVTPESKDIDFRWEPPGNVRLVTESQDAREIVFVPKDTKPAVIIARGRVPGTGDDLGEARGTVTARPYKVTVKVIGPLGPPPLVWDGKQHVEKKGEIAVHQNVRLTCGIEPNPPGEPRCQWSLNEDSHFDGNNITKDVTVKRSRVGTCVATVVFRNAEGLELGRGSGSFSVSISDEALSKGKEQREKAEKLKKEAESLISQGKFDAAEKVIKELEKLDPAAAGELRAKLAAAVKKSQESAEFYNQRGITKGKAGDSKGAIKDYTEAIRLKPDFADAYYNRGIDRRVTGDTKGAIEDYTMAIKYNPNYASAYNNRGFAKEKLGDNYGAIEDYTMAIKCNPNHASAYNNRGVSKESLGDIEGAIADYKKALEVKPDYEKARDNLDELLAKTSGKEFKVALTSTAGTASLGDKVDFKATVKGGTPPYQYDWFKDREKKKDLCSNTPKTTDGISITIRNEGSYTSTYTVRVTDSKGKEAEASTTLKVVAADKPSASSVSALSVSLKELPKPDESKYKDVVMFEAEVKDGTPPFTYELMLDGAKKDTLTRTTGSSSEFTGMKITEPGSHTVKLLVTDATGRKGDASVSVTVKEAAPPAVPLFVSVTPSKRVADVGEEIDIDGKVSGGRPPYKYTWYTDRGKREDLNAKSITTSLKSPGNRTYELLVTDSAGNSAKAQCSFSVRGQRSTPLALALTPGNVNVNVGERVSLSTRVQGGTPPYRYVWYDNGVEHRDFASDTKSITWTVRDPQSRTIKVVVTDGAGNSSSAQSSINVRGHASRPSTPPAGDTGSSGSDLVRNQNVYVTYKNRSSGNIHMFATGQTFSPANRLMPGEEKMLRFRVGSDGRVTIYAGRDGHIITQKHCVVTVKGIQDRPYVIFRDGGRLEVEFDKD
ncbi:MAG: tetratricopeptide repeat protein [Candidatus Eremiobacteraeota bacterium]|nr:tetratricopeptide repeat protein [Candidatus Eremiobacteraeota bacterium]